MGNRKVKEQSVKETSPAKTTAAVLQPAKSQKKIKGIDKGRIYINASYNNTVISVTDLLGNVLAWASAGSLGFSGPKKSTPFVASKIVSVIAEKMKAIGLTDIDIFVKGIGSGRDSAIRSLVNQGFNISSLKDVTPIPHNGPRPRKVRRV